MTFYENISDLIGQTPMYKLSNIADSNPEILVKLEMFNPGGSVKDRICSNMIKTAEEKGQLKPGDTIIEPTSGNTGIGLAMIGTSRGYKVILTMPDTMSKERRNILKSYGADLILTPGEDGMKGAINRAGELVTANENYFMPQQFQNPANPEIHRQTTAREILEDTEGELDYFVAGVGTGGTLTGVGEVLKEHNPDITIVAVEPADSSILSGGEPGSHKIQGIGAGFIPEVLNTDIIDRVITIENERAIEVSRMMAQKEGLFIGISSGAAVAASLTLASDIDEDNRIVTIAPDTGERYLSTEVFNFNN